MPINRKYGWAPDLPDNRDHLYSAPQPVLAKLPPKKDLRSGCPPVYDQGQLGSCTANAISGAVQFEQKKQAVKVFMPSRLFVYYNERSIEGTVNSDAGAQIRDGIKSVASLGVVQKRSGLTTSISSLINRHRHATQTQRIVKQWVISVWIRLI